MKSSESWIHAAEPVRSFNGASSRGRCTAMVSVVSSFSLGFREN